MEITTAVIKKLRDKTGVSVMQCKKALEEANGDMEQALLILSKKSADIASKKSEREVKNGLVVIDTQNGKAAVVVLNCETDFVAKNEDFVALADEILKKAVSEGSDTAKAASEKMINPVIQKLGENIQLDSVNIIEGENLGTYVHGGKIGVIVSIMGGNKDLAKNIAMHIAAMKPQYTSKDDIDESTQTMTREMFEKEVADMNKPEDIKKKILQGKIDTYFRERTLLDQPFIKDDKKTIEKLLKESGAQIADFKLYSLRG